MVMCVYDVTNPESYDHATEWLRKVKDVCGGNKRLPGVLVANKMDQVGLDGEGQAVDEARARKFAENQGLEFFACSAVRWVSITGFKTAHLICFVYHFHVHFRHNMSSVTSRSIGWPIISSSHM
jgi:GTPase SAR1 family protein